MNKIYCWIFSTSFCCCEKKGSQIRVKFVLWHPETPSNIKWRVTLCTVNWVLTCDLITCLSPSVWLSWVTGCKILRIIISHNLFRLVKIDDSKLRELKTKEWWQPIDITNYDAQATTCPSMQNLILNFRFLVTQSFRMVKFSCICWQPDKEVS